MFLVFDTETTGLPIWKDPSDHPDQPHVVDIACSLFDQTGLETDRYDAIINCGVPIPEEAASIHGITTEIAEAEGVKPDEALDSFLAMVARCEVMIGHNVSFDIRMMRIMAARLRGEKWDNPKPIFCTMRRATKHCKILSPKARHPQDWKWPTLAEATRHFFNEDHQGAHRARPDCDASARIFFHFREQGIS
ncbi:3'-5' exonuclease [Altererythrobacter indicus]|uniref:3'-5' exonuclease n=1 Tax=Altericroceibacterium indicum TaxID=374177 RepID=A0A845A5K8_9SPHN|nr:3'-5' exonuclease [Altericroceibacterium indicum]MXP24847.1 3'-5' exonuclease [Altericroceibacterium indicum]